MPPRRPRPPAADDNDNIAVAACSEDTGARTPLYVTLFSHVWQHQNSNLTNFMSLKDKIFNTLDSVATDNPETAKKPDGVQNALEFNAHTRTRQN